MQGRREGRKKGRTKKQKIVGTSVQPCAHVFFSDGIVQFSCMQYLRENGRKKEREKDVAETFGLCKFLFKKHPYSQQSWLNGKNSCKSPQSQAGAKA